MKHLWEEFLPTMMYQEVIKSETKSLKTMKNKKTTLKIKNKKFPFIASWKAWNCSQRCLRVAEVAVEVQCNEVGGILYPSPVYHNRRQRLPLKSGVTKSRVFHILVRCNNVGGILYPSPVDHNRRQRPPLEHCHDLTGVVPESQICQWSKRRWEDLINVLFYSFVNLTFQQRPSSLPWCHWSLSS